MWNPNDRVVLPTMAGERTGTIKKVSNDGEIKIVFDDDLDDTGMWFPPQAVLNPEDYKKEESLCQSA